MRSLDDSTAITIHRRRQKGPSSPTWRWTCSIIRSNMPKDDEGGTPEKFDQEHHVGTRHINPADFIKTQTFQIETYQKDTQVICIEEPQRQLDERAQACDRHVWVYSQSRPTRRCGSPQLKAHELHQDHAVYEPGRSAPTMKRDPNLKVLDPPGLNVRSISRENVTKKHDRRQARCGRRSTPRIKRRSWKAVYIPGCRTSHQESTIRVALRHYNDRRQDNP